MPLHFLIVTIDAQLMQKKNRILVTEALRAERNWRSQTGVNNSRCYRI